MHTYIQLFLETVERIRRRDVPSLFGKHIQEHVNLEQCHKGHLILRNPEGILWAPEDGDTVP